jgi:hypothetical protein
VTNIPTEPALPAFIDPPGPFATLGEWVTWRAELDTIDVPYLEVLKREADRMIEQLSDG